jgi:methylenetetrahydrofolate dehydrogenase (NADP+)/methenyltetrahydrofolate cyclohydrolase
MILDGKKIAAEILNQVKSDVKKLSFQPVFCDILVGADPASIQYVKMKAETAETVGIKFRNANFPINISTADLVEEIKKISQEPNMCGMIVQLPLPKNLNKQLVLDAISPKIDVDCLGVVNTNLFYENNAFVEFPTATAIIEILKRTGQDLKDKNILVIGFGQLVGRPVSFLLEQQGYKVKVATNKTENITELMKEADVIISAAGKAKLVTGEKIKSGSIIVDAGTSESDSGVVGDVDFDSVKEVAGFISPVPGGVGPVTVAMLLLNVVKVAKVIK